MFLCAQTALFLTSVKEMMKSLIFVKTKEKQPLLCHISIILRTFADKLLFNKYMDNKKNKFIAVAYKLYTGEGDERHLVEETKQGQPFSFISGFGFALDKFEDIITETAQGQDFSFTLTKDEAYGDYHDDYVLDLERDVFSINGHFDHEHIYKDAIVPLQNEEGHRFNGRVVEVGEEKVKIDLNHPLAGETLHFKGTVLENRDATEAEVNHLMKHLAGGCGCGSCGGDCGGNCGGDCGGCGDDGCEHEHHHEGGCGCGHCH